MTVVVALVAAVSVFFIVTGGVRASLAESLGRYLLPTEEEDVAPRRSIRSAPWMVSVLVGGLMGALASQGDLFISGTGRSAPILSLLGATGGYFVWSSRRTNAQARKARNLRFELPIVADAIALHVVAGDSVHQSIRSVTQDMTGVAVDELTSVLARQDEGSVDELTSVLARQDEGSGLTESLREAGEATAHQDGRRLYDLLGHAHESGGRLALMLAELSVDLRAGIERDLTAEGGKRAIATYGPILALMVPTALLFLLYPTLLGLRALSGTQ
jgi:Flp pilus assembly protein TadB